MIQKTLCGCGLLMLLWSCNDQASSDATKNDTNNTITISEPEKKVNMPDSATMMKNWGAYMTIGEVHKMMAGWDGTWSGKAKMYVSPDAPPDSSVIKTTNKMIMGGRYQVGTHVGNMMGMPFEGTSTMAYDNAKKKFISTWIDNMGTGITVMEGSWDEASKTITTTGKCVAADMGDGTEIPMRETFKIVDKDHHTMQMFITPAGGKEYMNMEIQYTRNKW